jgi:hypothetical protein
MPHNNKPFNQATSDHFSPIGLEAMSSLAASFGCQFRIHDEVATGFTACYDCLINNIRFEVEVKHKWNARALSIHADRLNPHVPFHYRDLHYAERKRDFLADMFATVGGDRLRMVITNGDVVRSRGTIWKPAKQDDGSTENEPFISVPVPSPTMMFFSRKSVGERWCLTSRFDPLGSLVRT